MYAWNTTVEDTSAILDFHPYSDGSASSGWAPYFEDIGFWSGQPGVDSFGKNSVHITEYSGASVTFRFEGTAIYLYGTQNCSYSVTVDSQPASIPFQSSLPDGMLFWQDNLSASTHTVSLTANPEPDNNQQLAFDKAVFTNIGINATGISPFLIDNQNVTSVQYTDDWKNQSFYNIPSDSSPSPYFETSNPKDAVSITFTGGAAVAINGARDWGHWTYTVTVDGAVSPVYNASTWWLMGDTVLFYQSNLDPQKTHTMQLANLGTPGDKLSLNYFTVYVPNGTAFNDSSASASLVPSGNTSATTPSPTIISSPAHSKTDVGIIVGPVVAGVVVLGAIIVALFFWLRPRRGAAPIMSDDAAGLADLSPAVAPYPQSMPQVAWNKEDEAGHPLAEMEVLTYPPVTQHQGDCQPPFAPIRLHSSASDPPAQPLASLAPGDSPSDAQSSRSVSRSTSTARLNDARVSPSSPRLNFEQIVELVVQRIGVRTGGSNESEAPPPEYVE